MTVTLSGSYRVPVSRPFSMKDWFIQAIGSTDGNVDVDAFTLTDQGVIYFSLADTESSSTLSGSQAGVVMDGAILRSDGQGNVSILYTEDDVDALLANALGGSPSAVDVQGLAWDAAQQRLLFTVQSPTSHDASVFTDQGGGALIPGYEEADLGFSGGIEMDALTLLPVMNDLTGPRDRATPPQGW